MNEQRKSLLQPPAPLKEKDSLQSTSLEIEKKRASTKELQERRRLARTFAKQQQISERLASATVELSAGVEQSQGAILELQQSIEKIASSAEQSSAASEESLAAISQIVGRVNQINQASKDSMSKAVSIQQLVSVSANENNRLVDGVTASAERSYESAKLVAELENMAQEIGNIIETVVNIADQTNLLALNAAIEAARAGEHGSDLRLLPMKSGH